VGQEGNFSTISRQPKIYKEVDNCRLPPLPQATTLLFCFILFLFYGTRASVLSMHRSVAGSCAVRRCKDALAEKLQQQAGKPSSQCIRRV